MRDDPGKFERIFEVAGYFFDAGIPSDVNQNTYISHVKWEGWQA